MIELVVAMFIFILIMGATFYLFVGGRRQAQRPAAAMRIQESLAQIVRYLQSDLTETNLQTVRTFPEGGGGTPGLSLESPRRMGGTAMDPIPDQLSVSSVGQVNWYKYVYYATVYNGAPSYTCTLIRKEGPLTDQPSHPDPLGLIPVASPLDPQWASGDAKRTRTLATNVVAPSLTIPGVGPTGTYGGFKVYFRNTSGDHPFRNTINDRDAPVRVDLMLADTSPETGKLTVLRHTLVITPRN